MAAPSPAARFRRVTGLPLPSERVGDLPAAFLAQQAPSPIEILETLPVNRRTTNVLRRFQARAIPPGPWTYGRLAAIPGFGLAALVDVLEAKKRRAGARGPRPGEARLFSIEVIVSLLAEMLPASEEEIARRLAAAGVPRRWRALAAIERAVRRLPVAAPFAVLRREALTVAVPADQLTLAATIHRLAVRSVLARGAASLRALAAQAGTADLAFVRAIVESHRAITWLDGGQDRFSHAA